MGMGGGGQGSSGYIYVLWPWGHIIEVTSEPRLGVKSWPHENLGEKECSQQRQQQVQRAEREKTWGQQSAAHTLECFGTRGQCWLKKKKYLFGSSILVAARAAHELLAVAQGI